MLIPFKGSPTLTDKLEIVPLTPGCTSRKHSGQLLDEHILGKAVKYQVVYVGEKVYALFRPYDCKAVQGRTAQAERHGLPAQCGAEGAFVCFYHGYVKGDILPYGTYLAVFQVKAHIHGGVRLYHCFYGSYEGIGVHVPVKFHCHGDVVGGALRILHALDIYACLGCGKWGGRLYLSGCVLALFTAQPLFKDDVLKAKQGDPPERLYGDIYVKALVQCGGQADSGNGCEPCVFKGGIYGDIAILEYFSYYGFKLGFKGVVGVGLLLMGLYHRLRESLAVHLAVLVEGDGIYLHDGGWEHIGGLSFKDKGRECLYVYLPVGHDVGGDSLALCP